MMAKVYKRRGESLNDMLARFDEQLRKDGTIAKCTQCASFESVGSKRRNKQAANRRQREKTAKWISRNNQTK